VADVVRIEGLNFSKKNFAVSKGKPAKMRQGEEHKTNL
jgi:hypothetical protein